MHLMLSHNRITDRGVYALARGLSHVTAVEDVYVNLLDNPMGDGGALSFAT